MLLFWLLDPRHLRNDGGQRAQGSEGAGKGVMHTAGSLGEGKSDLFQVTSSRDSGATVYAVSQRTDSLSLCLLQHAGR